MRRCRINLSNRYHHLISRVAHRAYFLDGDERTRLVDFVRRVVSQRGATYPVDYAYNEFGEKVSMTTYRDFNGERGMGNGEPGAGNGSIQGDVTRWLRDEATGLVTNKVYADGKGPCYDYTPDGRLATRTWARGIVTAYSYADNGALTNTVYSDGTPTISLAYNRAGRQIRAEDASGVTTFLYDGFGAVTNETVIGVAGTNTIERFYDDFGRDAGYALNGVCQSTLAYDPATGRFASMHTGRTGVSPVPNEVPFIWSYLPGSDLKSSLAYPNGLTAFWQYDANNQLLQVCNATPTNVISQYDYVYDAAGRRINVSKSGTAFNHDDTIAYGYNEKSELTNAVAAVDSAYRYAYDFDDIGNRESSSERGTNSVYTANQLNQYTAVDDFIPQFDDDGNQTLVKTVTGVWQISYNGENRPVLWSNGTTNITMKFDRMGRRMEYLEMADIEGETTTNTHRRFVYDGYLCIQRLDVVPHNAIDLTFTWNPAEPVATRPLMIEKPNVCMFHITHDGNKNVSDLVLSSGGSDIAAHYKYAPFGEITASSCNSTSTAHDFCTCNPFRFSCEYADDALGLSYYNYRHYEQKTGRWLQRDLLETADPSPYLFAHNYMGNDFDYIGLTSGCKKCIDHLNEMLANRDDIQLDAYKFIARDGGQCKLSFGCSTNCVNSRMGGYTSYRESGMFWWKDVTITIMICAKADGTLKKSEIETRTTLIHELSHARDLCKARKPIKCGGVGSQDMKRLICTEIRAYRNAEGIRDKEACIDRAINSVQVVCRHKRGTWAEYRWHLKKEADKIYDECIKGVW